MAGRDGYSSGEDLLDGPDRRKLLLVVGIFGVLFLLIATPIVETESTFVATIENDDDRTHHFDARVTEGGSTVDRTSGELAPGETFELGPVAGTDDYAIVAERSDGEHCELSGEFAPGSGGTDISATGSGFGCEIDVRSGPTVTRVNLGIASFRID